MKLPPEELARRKREKMLDLSRTMGADTYCRKYVAPIFQRMIRAEAGMHTHAVAVVDGKIMQFSTPSGRCVCITCGKMDTWDSGIKGMHTGHFLASRRNSILMDEDNVAPQCSSCNFYRSGAPNEFRMWMESVRGLAVIERLEALKRKSVSFVREDLVDMKINFSQRLKTAEDTMKGIL